MKSEKKLALRQFQTLKLNEKNSASSERKKTFHLFRADLCILENDDDGTQRAHRGYVAKLRGGATIACGDSVGDDGRSSVSGVVDLVTRSNSSSPSLAPTPPRRLV